MNTSQQRIWLDIAVFVAATIPCLTVYLLATAHGIGLLPDTAGYFAMARNPLTAGGGFPPGYSLLLALFNLSVDDLRLAAWWANATLLVFSLLVIFVATRVATGSRMAGALAVLLVGTSSKVLPSFSVAMSEPAFLASTLLALVILAHYPRSSSQLAALTFAGLAMGMAVLSRFAAAPLIAVCWMVIWLNGPRAALAKLAQAAFATLIALLPLAAWLSYGRFMLNVGAEQSVGRKLAFLGQADLATFQRGVEALGHLILPSFVAVNIRTAVLICVVIGTVFLLRRYSALAADASRRSAQLPPLSRFPMIAAMFICCYAAFLIVSVFIQANLPLHGRYMVPIYTAFVPMVVIAGFHVLRDALSPERLVRVAAVVSLVLVASVLPRGAYWAVESLQEGPRGYAGAEWQNSELIAHVRSIQPGVPIYSNGPDAIVLLTGRRARRIPVKLAPLTGLINETYEADMAMMERDLRENDGILVYFRTIDWRSYLPDEDEIQSQTHLRPIHNLADGAIYGAPVDS